MTPAARLQAAIEVLDEVIASARDDGPPADTIVTRYFKQRRYAGSKDRRAVRELVFRAIRRSGERPAQGRAALIGLAKEEPALLELFGQPRGPEPLAGRRHLGHPVGEQLGLRRRPLLGTRVVGVLEPAVGIGDGVSVQVLDEVEPVGVGVAHRTNGSSLGVPS